MQLFIFIIFYQIFSSSFAHAENESWGPSRGSVSGAYFRPKGGDQTWRLLTQARPQIVNSEVSVQEDLLARMLWKEISAKTWGISKSSNMSLSDVFNELIHDPKTGLENYLIQEMLVECVVQDDSTQVWGDLFNCLFLHQGAVFHSVASLKTLSPAQLPQEVEKAWSEVKTLFNGLVIDSDREKSLDELTRSCNALDSNKKLGVVSECEEIVGRFYDLKIMNGYWIKFPGDIERFYRFLISQMSEDLINQIELEISLDVHFVLDKDRISLLQSQWSKEVSDHFTVNRNWQCRSKQKSVRSEELNSLGRNGVVSPALAKIMSGREEVSKEAFLLLLSGQAIRSFWSGYIDLTGEIPSTSLILKKNNECQLMQPLFEELQTLSLHGFFNYLTHSEEFSVGMRDLQAQGRLRNREAIDSDLSLLSLAEIYQFREDLTFCHSPPPLPIQRGSTQDVVRKEWQRKRQIHLCDKILSWKISLNEVDSAILSRQGQFPLLRPEFDPEARDTWWAKVFDLGEKSTFLEKIKSHNIQSLNLNNKNDFEIFVNDYVLPQREKLANELTDLIASTCSARVDRSCEGDGKMCWETLAGWKTMSQTLEQETRPYFNGHAQCIDEVAQDWQFERTATSLTLGLSCGVMAFAVTGPMGALLSTSCGVALWKTIDSRDQTLAAHKLAQTYTCMSVSSICTDQDVLKSIDTFWWTVFGKKFSLAGEALGVIGDLPQYLKVSRELAQWFAKSPEEFELALEISGQKTILEESIQSKNTAEMVKISSELLSWAGQIERLKWKKVYETLGNIKWKDIVLNPDKAIKQISIPFTNPVLKDQLMIWFASLRDPVGLISYLKKIESAKNVEATTMSVFSEKQLVQNVVAERVATVVELGARSSPQKPWANAAEAIKSKAQISGSDVEKWLKQCDLGCSK